ncbi:MAG: class I SAM-dependent methyltransferase [Anaerolineae bacterium]|nr:class I SAM-dependent methyltransferase [Anaerolineae bacterium]
MTVQAANASFGKSVKEFWHALLLIVPITLRWVWMLITNINQPQVKKSEMIWDMLSKNMDRYAQNEGLKKFEVSRDEKLKKYLQGSDVVLDYGCGTGAIALKFADTVQEIHGIDTAGKMIEVAQGKAAERQIENVDFAQSTIFDERLRSESFDVVLAWGILHLVDDRQNVINRINDLLKPGGLLISATECLGEQKTAITSLLSLLMKIGIFPIMLKFFTVSELEDAIICADFQIVQTEIMADNPVSCFIAAKKTEKTTKQQNSSKELK